MGDELLIRVYNVGFGDCIYVQVPDRDPDTGKNEPYHILIDCGSRNKGGRDDALESALQDVFGMLPKVNGNKRRLDLLVVTHKHADHISGFDPDLRWLKDMKIERIWLSASMKKTHPDAKGYRTLQDLESRTLRWFDDRGLHLGASLRAVIQNNIAPANARKALTTGLLGDSKTEPMYVYRGVETDPAFREHAFENLPSDKDADEYLLKFREDRTQCWILAPEWRIDDSYLSSRVRDRLQAFDGHIEHIRRTASLEDRRAEPTPTNISQSDFQRLRTRLWYAALAFSDTDSELINNTSVVLLLEWRGRRLLFAGDAQERNWDAMWRLPEVKQRLDQRVDFLKVGHHGSHNGTPWDDEPGAEQPILDAILPKGGKAQVVISTLEGVYKKRNEIPAPKLLTELRARADSLLRTDKQGQDYIEVKLGPAPGWSP